MPRTLLVEGQKTFMIEIPDDAKVTFGPFSPPSSDKGGYARDPSKALGTLRVYKGAKADTGNIIAVFTDVKGFRDITQVEYTEQVMKLEGESVWKSDKEGYQKKERVKRATEWVKPALLLEGAAGDDE